MTLWVLYTHLATTYILSPFSTLSILYHYQSMYAYMFYPDWWIHKSACAWFSHLFTPPFPPALPFLFLYLAGPRQMGLTLWSGFTRWVLLKVSSCLKIVFPCHRHLRACSGGGSGSGFCKAPSDNPNCCWRTINKWNWIGLNKCTSESHVVKPILTKYILTQTTQWIYNIYAGGRCVYSSSTCPYI